MDGGEVVGGEPEAGGGAVHFLARVWLGAMGMDQVRLKDKKYTLLWAPSKLAQIITLLWG
jgi:hypothetical protein